MITPARVPELGDDIFTQKYLEWTDDFEFSDQDEESFRVLRKRTRNITGLIIELACGSGKKAFHLARAYPDATVVGVDIHRDSIKKAESTYSLIQPNLYFAQADGYMLDRHVENVDMITCVESLHHFDDLEGIANQMDSVLRPGGILTLQDFDRRRINEVLAMTNMKEAYKGFKDARELPDEKCMRLLKRKGLLNGRCHEVLLLMSIMAAYTPEEVVGAFPGYKGDVASMKDGTYRFFLQKPPNIEYHLTHLFRKPIMIR